MMLRYLSISLALASLTTAGTLRAASKPHAVPASRAEHTWTNEDLEQLRKIPGLISVVGQSTNEAPQDGGTAPLLMTEDLARYAAQSASWNARLEAEEAGLRDFQQKLKDAQELDTTTPGINLDEPDPGLTPEATIEILQGRVRETQSELGALEDLARRNGIAPGILRGQYQDVTVDGANATEHSEDDRSARGGDL